MTSITHDHYLRFARQLLEDNCELEKFDVEVRYDEIAALREAFEELGCTVRESETRPRLVVSCPPRG